MQTPFYILPYESLHQLRLMRFQIAPQRLNDQFALVAEPALSNKSAHLLMNPRRKSHLGQYPSSLP